MADTIYQSFAEVAARHTAGTALMRKVEGVYQGISYAQLGQTVDEVAAGLARRGLQAGGRLGIYSYNRPEWVITDLAAIKLGAVVVPVYHTLPSDSIRYILREAEVSHLVVESPELLDNLSAILDDLPAIKCLITLHETRTDGRSGKNLISYGTLRASGAEALAADPKLRGAHRPDPDDLVTVVYTSGTTGEPKGAMLSHRNILSNVRAAIERFSLNETDILVSFLPLCHMFERTCGYYTMLMCGGTIAYAESMLTIAQDVQAVKPTMLIVVPRVLEKVYNTVTEKVLTGPSLKRRLMVAALRTYGRYARVRMRHATPSLWLRFKHWLLGRLVVSKLRALAGGRLRLLVSGGAPLDRRLARIVRNLEFNLLEGYGLTETSPVVCSALPGEKRVGTVGRPFPGVEIRIGANDEILVRGPNVMKGYLNKPEETAAVLRDGWFHTGDQGRIDPSGNVVITGRIKELIVNSYGKNIAPVPIELALSGSESGFIEQAIVIGDRRPYLTALIVPGRLVLEKYARENNIRYDNHDQLLADARIRDLFRREIDAALENFGRHEQIRAFRLVAEPFTVENGLLTPSLKMRRPVINETYRAEIGRLYEGDQ